MTETETPTVAPSGEASEAGPAPVTELYLLLARCFSYPGRDLYEALGGKTLGDELKALVAALPFDFQSRELPSPSLDWEDFESEYISTFDISPACPLYESSYAREDMSSRDLYEEIVRFYRHFDITLPASGRDYHDHLVAELEFMAFLSSKEADARRRDGDAEPYQRAQRDFLERHLGRWVGVLHERVEQHTREQFYKGATGLLVNLVERHHRHLQDELAKADSAPRVEQEGSRSAEKESQ
ncbi:MAG: molecular chaperone TorD family protein [Planctomycetes bacterium]|nr:molecular chaperone TorD family protein [Planctomycetota bacterium]